MRAPIRHQTAIQKYHPIKRILFSPLGLIFWLIFCVFVSLGLWKSVNEMRQSITREAQAKQRLEQEEKKALEIIDKLNEADTPFAKEKIIRDELQMQRPDETVIQIPKDSSSSSGL